LRELRSINIVLWMIFGVLVVVSVVLIRQSQASKEGDREWERIKQGAVEQVRRAAHDRR
jgi:cytochrome c-type biogenesis protein CcmH/NrfF